MKLRYKLIMVVAAFLLVFATHANAFRNVQRDILVIHNCDMETAVGWVTWDDPTKKSYTSQPVDVYGRAITVIDPAEYKIYAITQYKWSANALVNFKEIEIKPGSGVNDIKFSCEVY